VPANHIFACLNDLIYFAFSVLQWFLSIFYFFKLFQHLFFSDHHFIQLVIIDWRIFIFFVFCLFALSFITIFTPFFKVNEDLIHFTDELFVFYFSFCLSINFLVLNLFEFVKVFVSIEVTKIVHWFKIQIDSHLLQIFVRVFANIILVLIRSFLFL
jgi:hypothetical protein